MDLPIRVLCVMSTLGRGGAETMVMNLFRNIDRDSVVFDFVKHSHGKDAYEDEITALGGKIYEAPRYKVYNHLSYKKWWKRFFSEHPEYKIIHGHYFNFSSVYFKIAKKFNRITVGHSHSTEIPKEAVTNKIINKVTCYYISKIEKHSDYCLACSSKAGSWMFPNKKYDLLKNAIAVDKFRYERDVATQVREEFKLEDSFVVGTVSRFNIEKNPWGLLDIFYRIHAKSPESKMLWVGEGPYKEEIISKAKEYGIYDSILFLGERSDVNRLLQCMDVFLLPSFYEGLPVVLVEAQAAGVCCCCSDAVTAEADVTSLCHFLPLEDYDKWVDVITALKPGYEHQDTYEQIKSAGYEITSTAEWLKDFYLKIISENSL